MIQDQLPLDGLPPLVHATVPERDAQRRARFAAKVHQTDARWIFLGAIGTDGYGRFWYANYDGQQRVVAAHIFAWKCAQTPGTTIDSATRRMHECTTTLCVRIGGGHVITGTQRENIRYADALGRRLGRRPVSTETPAESARRIQNQYRSSATRTLAGGLTWAGCSAKVGCWAAPIKGRSTWVYAASAVRP